MADQDLMRGHAAGIARGAAVIAGLTVLSRILGLVRTLVFSQRVGASCLGTAYITANQVPNLVYELVVGGALTSAMIPVLARSAERAADRPAGTSEGQPYHFGPAHLVRSSCCCRLPSWSRRPRDRSRSCSTRRTPTRTATAPTWSR
jgi:hypothetical protein